MLLTEEEKMKDDLKLIYDIFAFVSFIFVGMWVLLILSPIIVFALIVKNCFNTDKVYEI